MRESKRGNRVHFALPEGCDARDVRGFSRPHAWRQMANAFRDADVVHFQKSLPPTTQVASAPASEPVRTAQPKRTAQKPLPVVRLSGKAQEPKPAVHDAQ